MSEIKVFTSALPFNQKARKALAAPGSSIKDIVNENVPDRFYPAGMGVVVSINGHAIDYQYWHNVRPALGTIINIHLVPQGGKGGKKSPITALVSIAVMIAAPYVAGAILGPTLAATQVGIGTLTYGGLLASGLGAVANLAISALAGPPKQSNIGNTFGGNAAESPTQFIEGAKNSVNPYGVIPCNLGTNRMFPMQAARAYTESQNNDQYVRQLMTYGFGNQVVMNDPRIGETSVREFSDFEIQHRLNGDLHEPTELYSNDVFQEDFSVILKYEDGFTIRETQDDIDEAIIDFTWPRGLCYYTPQGQRTTHSTELELQYAKVGESPEDWTPASIAYKDFTGSSITVSDPIYGVHISLGSGSSTQSQSGSLISIYYVDKYSGIISVIENNTFAYFVGPQLSVPANGIRLATVTSSVSRNPQTGVETRSRVISDDRTNGLFGHTLKDENSFVPSLSGNVISFSGGAIKINDLYVTGNQSEALRISRRIIFPEKAKYKFRVRRMNPESTSDQVFDTVALTAIKSVKYQAPVRLKNLNGSAIRIRGTDQLNGMLDQFNVIVSTIIPDYDEFSDTWIERASSNPASIYRYILQGPANAVPLSDNKIALDDLEDWHRHCVEQGYTYNRVIDYETSIEDVLRDVAAAGAASPAIIDGKRTIVIDRINDDVVGFVTPRNSWGYSGRMIYPEIPHAFRVKFRNADKGYVQDERIVYDDGYNEDNATKFEELELQSCTNAALAFKTGRRHLASIRLRPESHTWMMDIENLEFTRGSRIKFEHDAPIIGVGDGRIKEVFTDGGSPEYVTGILIDDFVTIPTSGIYYVRIRLSDGTLLYKQINTVVGGTSEFTFSEPFPILDSPAAGDLCYFVEAGGEVDLVITKIEPQADLTARITAVDYAPAVHTAENATIPPWNSNITIPLEFIRPLPPILIEHQSDESVMLINSDGSFTPRAIFTLQNRNDGDIRVSVRIRSAGTSAWTNANVLEATAGRLIITGMEDGSRYDIHIRYRRAGSSILSLPLQINNFLFIGASGNPNDVTGFRINVSGETAFFEWNKNTDIDISHYRMKFTAAFTGATWGTSQLVKNRIDETRISMPFRAGTYLIKAVDRLGNESENAQAIITYDPGQLRNAVENLQDDPLWPGIKDNTVAYDGLLTLENAGDGVGYYYFENIVNLSDVFISDVAADIQAYGIFVNNMFDMEDMFASANLFGAGDNDLFAEPDIFAMDDIFGIGADAWTVTLEYSISMSDPDNSPPEWEEWQELIAGDIEFYAIRFRLKLTSNASNISPAVHRGRILVDMPDRIERGDDIECPEEGVYVEFVPAFKANPAVVITIQGGDADDEVHWITKTSGGFEIRIYNKASASYVSRTFDFIASGYGRKTQ